MTQAFRIGSLAQDLLTGLKLLACTTTVSTYYDCLQSPVGVNYVVPGGKKLIITKIIYSFSGATSSVIVGYGDNAVNDSATPPTNWKALSSNLMSAVAYTKYEVDVYIEIPAGKYPHLLGPGGAMFATVQGVEVDA